MEAIVEYNYEAQEPDELTLKKGDVITEIKVTLGGWWEGTLRDRRGMFPDNFVKVILLIPSKIERPLRRRAVKLRSLSRKRYCSSKFKRDINSGDRIYVERNGW